MLWRGWLRHSAETKEIASESEPLQLAENNEGCWRARRDSNSRPIAPEDLPHEDSET